MNSAEQLSPPSSAWRQGSIVGHELIGQNQHAISVSMPIPQGALIILVSQDCDIVHSSYEAEPFIELLLANRQVEEDKGLQWGKHPRRFQFWHGPESYPMLFEININDRYRVDRRVLLGGLPRERVDRKLAEMIGRWIAKRYTRAAFPDEFNRRCDPVKGKVAQLFKKRGDLILSLHIRLEPEDEELTEGKDY